MKKPLFVCLLTAALALLAGSTRTTAQTLGDLYLTATSADCSTAGSCALFDPGFVPSTTLTVSGTFSLTVTFEATADGINWVSAQAVNVASGANVTTATSAGVFNITNAGFLKIRARASAYASGSAKITATRGVASAKLLTPTFGNISTTGSLFLPSGGSVYTSNWGRIEQAADGQFTVSNNANTVTRFMDGTLTTSTTGACTIADTNETTLWTYTLPAGALSADGRGVRVTAWGTSGATANTKTGKLYFGAAVPTVVSMTSSGAAWRMTEIVLRTSATAQATWGEAIQSSASSAYGAFTGSETMANAIVIKMTGQNGTAAANDICFSGVVVETIK